MKESDIERTVFSLVFPPGSLSIFNALLPDFMFYVTFLYYRKFHIINLYGKFATSSKLHINIFHNVTTSEKKVPVSINSPPITIA